MAANAADELAALEGDMIAAEPGTSVVSHETGAVVADAPVADRGMSLHGKEEPCVDKAAPLASGHTSPEAVNCDAIIVGTGFSGIKAMYRLRKLVLGVKAFEAGSDFGAVWC
jgi:hypothetical protein